MSDCFPSASDMRDIKKVGLEVYDEVCAIKRSIIIANEACSLEVCIEDTPMTTVGDELSEKYWRVWQGYEEDRTLELWMNEVIKCIESLGYNIERVTNCESGDTFKWCASW